MSFVSLLLTKAKLKVMIWNKCTLTQGCQMVYFQTKTPKWGKFRIALDWKMLKIFMASWIILQSYAIFYGQLVWFVFIWYIFPVLVSCTKNNLATLR
jgi:hypothetical protein